MISPTHTQIRNTVITSYQIISSQHLFLHVWNRPQRLQIRKAVLHHKGDGGSVVTGDEPRGQSQQALLQAGNGRKATQLLHGHDGVLWARKHGITRLTT